MTFIYVMPLHEEYNGYGNPENGGIPPAQQTPPNEPEKPPPPKNACTKFLGTVKQKMTCKCCHHSAKPDTETPIVETDPTGCFSCLKKKKKDVEEAVPARVTIEDETGKKCKFLRKLCCRKDRVGDRSSCFPLGRRKDSWTGRTEDSILSSISPTRSKCSKNCSKDVLTKIFCISLCCKKKVVEEPVRKPSVVSKKKSLTPTSVPPPEDIKPKIDMSLVEHTSHMKGAIPILPVYLAWFCLVINCIAPGTGTFMSGLFCLCIGIPRFSQKDGPKPRIGSFIINTIIGFSQFFTVLFCLVGWGWAVWWGVIMIKVARKHKKIKQLEAFHQATQPVPVNNRSRDPERHN